MATRKRSNLLKNKLLSLLSVALTLLIFAGLALAVLYMQLPNVKTLQDVHLQVPLRIYTADKQLIAQYGTKRRIPITLDQVPKPMVEAVLAVEDKRFFEHPGVDFIGLMRATKAVILSGRKVQGASTITMQVARNFFLSRKKTYSRKIVEILLALKIDHTFSKKKILELYLNKVYLGKRAYGVAAAAQVYYGKSLSELSLAQMAMIAGLPQAPSRDNPIANPVDAKDRRDHVLDRMRDAGYITKAQYAQAVQEPVTASYHREDIQVHAPYVADMIRKSLFARYGESIYSSGMQVFTTIQSRLQNDANISLSQGLIAYTKRHGYRRSTQHVAMTDVQDQAKLIADLKNIPQVNALLPAVITAVDAQTAQAVVQGGRAVSISWSGMSWARPILSHGVLGRPITQAHDILSVGDIVYLQYNAHDKQWVLSQVPKIQGALVAINPHNGAILAVAGGFNYLRGHYNHVTQAVRQPGSSFKPMIYSAALAKGFTLASIINDAPVVIQDSGENRLWRPHNVNNRFYGPTRLRVGLMDSRNLVSIRLLQSIGIPYALQYIQRFGFNTNDLPHTLSLALGSGGITPLSLDEAYAVFANGGYHVKPFIIDKTYNQFDQLTFQAQPLLACQVCVSGQNTVVHEPGDAQSNSASATGKVAYAPQVLTVQNAYLMTQALIDVIKHGTGRRALVLKRSDLAGKTGTTNDKTDAWFAGFNGDVATTVWVGFDDAHSTKEFGSQVALPIWINFMGDALKGKALNTLAEPDDIVSVRIDPATGLLAAPNQRNAMFEVFRKQFAPKHFATVDALPSSPVNSTAGESSNTSNTSNTRNTSNANDSELQSPEQLF